MEEEELDRFRVIGEDGSWLTVLAVRLIGHAQTPRGPRRIIGRRAWRLSSGEALDLVDREHFILRNSGEMLRRIMHGAA